MDKYGFVYIWYDRKHQRFYIGCRWGREDDGYICSSRWMRKSYKRRPEDFKRRTIAKVFNRNELLEEEFRWLSMIKDHELGSRYYNLTKRHFGHWTTNKKKLKTVGQKISEANKGREVWSTGKTFSEEHRKNLSLSHIGNVSPRKGKTHTKSAKKKMSLSKKGKYCGINNPSFGKPKSLETRQKISEKLKGRKISKVTRIKMKKAQQKRRAQEGNHF